MNANELQTLQALLVALVKLPDSETAPQFDPNVLKSPLAVVANVENRRLQFWQLYEEAYDEFTHRYNAKPRNKAMPPVGDPPSNTGVDNVAVSSAQAIDIIDRLEGIFSSDTPGKHAEKQFKNRENKNLDVYEWAEMWCNL